MGAELALQPRMRLALRPAFPARYPFSIQLRRTGRSRGHDRGKPPFGDGIAAIVFAHICRSGPPCR
jgi:hypothetical protein